MESERFNLVDNYTIKWKYSRNLKFLMYMLIITLLSLFVSFDNIYIEYFINYNSIFFLLLIVLLYFSKINFIGYLEFNIENNILLIKNIYRKEEELVSFNSIKDIYIYNSESLNNIYLVEVKYKIENRTKIDILLDRYYLRTRFEFDIESCNRFLSIVSSNSYLNEKVTIIK